jgi:hypothetical protein
MSKLPPTALDCSRAASGCRSVTRRNFFPATDFESQPATSVFCPSSPRAPSVPYKSVFRISRDNFLPC